MAYQWLDQEYCSEEDEEGTNEEVAPEVSVGEEDDEICEEEGLTNSREEFSVDTEGVAKDPVESQTVDQSDQFTEQRGQLETVHFLLLVDPPQLWHLGEEGEGDHAVSQEGGELGEHHVTQQRPIGY